MRIINSDLHLSTVLDPLYRCRGNHSSAVHPIVQRIIFPGALTVGQVPPLPSTATFLYVEIICLFPAELRVSGWYTQIVLHIQFGGGEGCTTTVCQPA